MPCSTSASGPASEHERFAEHGEPRFIYAPSAAFPSVQILRAVPQKLFSTKNEPESLPEATLNGCSLSSRCSPHSEAKQCPRPALILLDYDLRGHTGVNFLYWLRLIKKISSIRVVMFSGTARKLNIAECYSTGANRFISKPRVLARLKIIVRTLHLSLVSLHRPGPIQLLEEYRPDPRESPMIATPA
jgi:CheY-like chemotaxis protein